MARKVVIAGNWKMNKTASEGKALVEALKETTKGICPNCADINSISALDCFSSWGFRYTVSTVSLLTISSLP